MRQKIHVIGAILFVSICLVYYQNCAQDLSPANYSNPADPYTVNPSPLPPTNVAPRDNISAPIDTVSSSCIPANGVSGIFSGSTCQAIICNNGFHNENGVCVSNIRSCRTNGNTGQEQWNQNTGQYENCRIDSCSDPNQHFEGGTCVSNLRPCQMAGAMAAVETWTGSGYGQCLLASGASCLGGYVNYNQSCHPPATAIYRYFRRGKGHYWAANSQDNYARTNKYGSQAGIGQAEGVSFFVFTSNPSSLIPLQSCGNVKSGHQANSGCSPVIANLGFLASNLGEYGSNMPVYFCISRLTGLPMTTAHVTECGGAPASIIGYAWNTGTQSSNNSNLNTPTPSQYSGGGRSSDGAYIQEY